MDPNLYDNPLVSRYASREMSRLWSPQHKHATWRRLWLALATAQQELGLDITDEQLAEMRAHLDDVDFPRAERYERQLRHDVMAHIHAWGDQCPKARPIIHLGATSCFVGDNTELLQLRASLDLLRGKLLRLLKLLRDFAWEHRQLPTLGFTHYQPAQLTTVGKRTCLWLHDFLLDCQEVSRRCDELPARGVKGTTGTQASFLELFGGDHDKVRALDQRVTELLGFTRSLRITGQTYSRKYDAHCLHALAGVGGSAAKMATDIRLLMNLREVDEPFEESQVGSSAMAYKRNPMRSERICALSRFLIELVGNASHTHAEQWFERTLDDSANRRLSLPQACLTADGILELTANVINGLKVWPGVIHQRIMGELPFMATEAIIMAGVRAGGDRQDLHEAIRRHAFEAARRMKAEGAANDLLERLADDPLFAEVKGQFGQLLDPARFVGRAPQQVEEFLLHEVDPFLTEHATQREQSTARVEV